MAPFGGSKYKKKSDLVSIGGLWVNEKSGNLGGVFRPEDVAKMTEIVEEAGAVRLTVLENRWQDGPKAAQYKLLAAPAEPRGGAPAPKKPAFKKPATRFTKATSIPDEDTQTEEVE